MISVALPFIEEKMKVCDTTKDLKLVSVCFITVYQLVQESLAKAYAELVTDLLNRNVINSNTSIATIIKILRAFYTVRGTHKYAVNPIRRILNLVEHSTQMNEFTAASEVSFFWIRISLDFLTEPSSLAIQLEEKACRLLETVDVDNPACLSLLSCITRNTSKERRKRVEHCLMEVLQQDDVYDPEFSLELIFSTVRRMKLFNLKLMTAFWEANLKYANLNQNNPDHLSKMCKYYLSLMLGNFRLFFYFF